MSRFTFPGVTPLVTNLANAAPPPVQPPAARKPGTGGFMRRVARLALGAFLGLVSPAFADTSALLFYSGPDWQTFDKDPGPTAVSSGNGFLGNAQAVCLEDYAPWPCPADALRYGTGAGGWVADLFGLPAVWVWAPRVTGQTSPAEFASFFFSKTFVLAGQPIAGYFWLAADDFAEVRVNGTPVGAIGSISDVYEAGDAQSYLHFIDMSRFLKPGANTITVRAQNGPASYSGACGETCTYAQNAAGVVFVGYLLVDGTAAAIAKSVDVPPGPVTILESPTVDSYCDAWDVNLQETVVGECDGMPVRWNHGALEILNGPVQSTEAGGTLVERPLVGGRSVGVNSVGQIVAEVRIRISFGAGTRVVSRAAKWVGGVWHDLGGTDSGGWPSHCSWAYPRGINERGDVIGTLCTGSVIIWHQKSVEVLPLLADADECWGYAINERGDAVGQCTFYRETTTNVPVLWEKGSVVELGSAREPDIVNYARTINNDQLIGGTASSAALVWLGGAHAPSWVAPLGAVNSVNERGQMVGNTGNDMLQATWWRNAASGRMVLGAPANSTSSARAISETGVVVGWVFPEGFSGRQAFIAR